MEAPGDTVNITPGTYTEAVSINKPNLTLKSTGGRDVTIVDNPDVGSETQGIGVLANMGVVTVDGFTVNNFRNGIAQGMAAADAGTAFHVLNNKIIPENNDTNPYLRNGIQVSGNGGQVIGNYVVGAPLTSDWQSSGIQVVNASNVLVSGNTVNTSGADVGISVSNWSADLTENITVEGNTVIGAKESIRVSGQSKQKVVKNVIIRGNVLKNSLYSGVWVQSVALNDIMINENEITGNLSEGIGFDSSSNLSGDILINQNKIYNNAHGIYNGLSYVVNALNNWWGHASGPEHATNPDGTGDKVSDYVNFNPWKTVDPNYVPPGPDRDRGDFDDTTFDFAVPLLATAGVPALVIAEGSRITAAFVTQGTAADLAAAKDAYQAAQQALNANRANMTPAEIALAEMDLAVAQAAILDLELVLGTGATTLAAAVAAYQAAVAAFAQNGGLLSAAQRAEVSSVLAAVAAALTARGAVL